MKILFWVLGIVVLLAVWVRVAPSNVERWHIDPETAASPGVGGYRTEMKTQIPPQEALRAIDTAAMATPRTKLFAGDIDSGRITYVTRSKIWRFPDYTTVSAVATNEGTRLVLLGRLRFGIGDMGVNRQRIKAWLKVLQPVQ